MASSSKKESIPLASYHHHPIPISVDRLLILEPGSDSGPVSIPSAPYNYHPLNPGSIRLLILEPGSDSDPVKIRRLFPVYMQPDIVQYVALSYMWALPEQPERKGREEVVLCEGQSILVTMNLYHALVALRSTVFCAVPLWIDQITINQEDNAEKAEQVKMMGEIFSNAVEVFVWLSNTIWKDVYLGSRMSEFNEIMNRFREARHRRLGADRIEEHSFNDSVAEEMNGFNPSADVWEAVCTVFGCGYMRRVWMIQEVVRAKNCFALISGGGMLWRYFEIGGLFLDRRMFQHFDSPVFQKLHSLPASLTLHTGGLSTIHVFEQALKDEKWGRKPKLTLLDLLGQTFMLFEATQERDKVFALIGLLGFADRCISTSITPDYSEDLIMDRLYRDVFVEGLKQGGLSALMWCTPETKASTPSWMGALDVGWSLDYTLINHADSFNAGGRVSHVQTVPDDHTALCFRITPLARVSATFHSFPGARNFRSKVDDEYFVTVDRYLKKPEVIDYFRKCAKFYQEESGRMWNDCREELYRAFTSDTTFEFGRDRIAMMVHDFNYRSHESFQIAPDDLVKRRIRLLEQVLNICDQEQDEFRESESLWNKHKEGLAFVLGLVSNMRFACATLDGDVLKEKMDHDAVYAKENSTSRRNRLICWLPLQAEVDDILCVVHGFWLPMIIRPKAGQPGRFRFYSVCYVHGFMDGEGLETEGLRTEDVIFA